MDRSLATFLIASTMLIGVTLVAGCGSPARDKPAEAPPDAAALEGAGWIGEAVDMQTPSDGIRVIAFFRPECLACRQEARMLNRVREAREKLVVIGVTESEDQASIAEFRQVVSADYPMLYGLASDTKKAYGVTYFPSIRVVDGDGKVIARDFAYFDDAESP